PRVTLPPLPVSSSRSSPPPHLSPLSLHDALPILPGRRAPPPGAAPTRRPLSLRRPRCAGRPLVGRAAQPCRPARSAARRTRYRKDRKSTRLNSSHLVISYAVFCLKKKKK